MIDRKLLKTNRWEDEEYLQARMTNACFNGGVGGDGGGDDEGLFGEDDDVSGGYGFDDAERDRMAEDIDRQMAAQAAARQAAAAQQQAIAAQQAQEQAARQAQAQAAAQAAARQAAQQQAQDQHVAAQAAQYQRQLNQCQLQLDKRQAEGLSAAPSATLLSL